MVQCPWFIHAFLLSSHSGESQNSGIRRATMLSTRICDLLGVDHPILGAPMSGGIAAADLAAAISEAGGFGLLGGMTTGGTDWLREQIGRVRERTKKPFGVGFISSFPGLDELVQVALEERVTAVSHSFADPTPYVVPAHTAGVKMIAQVKTEKNKENSMSSGAFALFIDLKTEVVGSESLKTACVHSHQYFSR